MGYERGDNRGGGDRWRERDYDRNRELGRNNQDWGRDDRSRDFDRNREDRGFFERAGDTVKSWLGDDDDQGRYGSRFGGNDRGSWNDRDRSRGQRDEEGYARGYQSSGGGSDRYGEDIGGGRSNEMWGGTGFGGTSGFGGGSDHGRRFDRIDAGSTGTHGVHPMSSPVGGAYGAGYGVTSGGTFGSTASRFGGSRSQPRTFQPGQDLNDRHYSEWRDRQVSELDRDYEEYRREHQSKFENEFGGWREKRQGQRQSMRKVTEHMEVVGSDGQHVGTVDCVRGDRLILTKSDENAGGIHHSIPCSWIESVDDKVTVNKSAAQAMDAWRDEERNRALFERQDQGSDGPHMLNRSFSGTYSDRND